MGVKRAQKPITDADIPAVIARDAETAASVATHEAKTDPHPIYLTQAEGDNLYPKFLRKLLTGLTPAAANDMRRIPHGVPTNAKITNFFCYAIVYPGSISEMWIPPGGLAPWIGNLYYYSLECNPTNIILRTGANSVEVLSKPVTVVVDYV